MNKIIFSLFVTLFFSSFSIHANWVCNVNDTKEHQYTFSAPQEDDAEKLSQVVCKTFGISQKDCTPDCFDTGVDSSRWHCVVQNQKRESWSFTTPSKDKAKMLAMNLCKNQKIEQKDCQPVCVPE